MVQLYMIVPLGGGHPDNELPGGGWNPVDPGYGNRPIHHPGHPDHGLPSGGGGARPSQPIYHPGHPDHGLPAFPSQGLPPYSPGSPDNSLPVPPGITPPDAPADMASQLIVLWRLPNTVEWHGKAMDPGTRPDQGLPPTGQPK